uniref:Uncharacterized protein n=1 Tax=Fagus sylvatica TaxID=28930 RepID=A0A2N9ICY3_FAGSY
MRRHAPRLSPANPPVLISAAESWMLRSSHHHHGSLRRHHSFHLTKFGDHLNGNAPPRAGGISGEILHQIHAPAPYPRPDPHPYFLMDQNAQGVFQVFSLPNLKPTTIVAFMPPVLSSISEQNQLWLPCHPVPSPISRHYQDIPL